MYGCTTCTVTHSVHFDAHRYDGVAGLWGSHRDPETFWRSCELLRCVLLCCDAAATPMQDAVVEEASEHFAHCGRCSFSFCSLCLSAWHRKTECVSAEVRLKLLKVSYSNELHCCATRREAGARSGDTHQDLYDQAQTVAKATEWLYGIGQAATLEDVSSDHKGYPQPRLDPDFGDGPLLQAGHVVMAWREPSFLRSVMLNAGCGGQARKQGKGATEELLRKERDLEQQVESLKYVLCCIVREKS